MKKKTWLWLGLIYIIVTVSFFGWYFLLSSVAPFEPQPGLYEETLPVPPEEIGRYLKENINDIAPRDPVMGGTWYVTDFTFDPEMEEGTVRYEDGHLQDSFAFFAYKERGKIHVILRDYVVLKPEKIGYANGLFLQFNELVADNRCPVNANCIEAGAVTVNITLTTSEGATETLNKASDEVPLAWKGYKISIENVRPVAMTNQEISQQDYEVTFKVE